MTERTIFDPGLQPERTALAWRRTGLAIIVGSLLAGRVLSAELGAFAFVPTGLALILGIGVVIGGEVRYRQHHRAMVASASDRIPLSGGGMIAILASAVLLLGIFAVGVVLIRAVG